LFNQSNKFSMLLLRTLPKWAKKPERGWTVTSAKGEHGNANLLNESFGNEEKSPLVDYNHVGRLRKLPGQKQQIDVSKPLRKNGRLTRRQYFF